MYLIGAEHPNKTRTLALLRDAIQNDEKFVTDVEVFQEIMHRYHAIGRMEFIQPACDLLEQMVEQVYPISWDDFLSAKDLLHSYAGVSSRDAIHAAIIKKHKIQKLMSFDKGYDLMPFIERIS